MSKLTIIQLLNKKANGEEMPKKIRIDHWCYNFEWIEHDENYYDKDNDIDLMSCLSMSQEELNYEVKIIEEKVKPLTKKDVEALGYACGEIQKCFTNGWKKSLENKLFKEDKEIEKLEVIDWNNCIHDVTHTEKKIFIEINKTQTKLNEIINYINNKD